MPEIVVHVRDGGVPAIMSESAFAQLESALERLTSGQGYMSWIKVVVVHVGQRIFAVFPFAADPLTHYAVQLARYESMLGELIPGDERASLTSFFDENTPPFDTGEHLIVYDDDDAQGVFFRSHNLPRGGYFPFRISGVPVSIYPPELGSDPLVMDLALDIVGYLKELAHADALVAGYVLFRIGDGAFSLIPVHSLIMMPAAVTEAERLSAVYAAAFDHAYGDGTAHSEPHQAFLDCFYADSQDMSVEFFMLLRKAYRAGQPVYTFVDEVIRLKMAEYQQVIAAKMDERGRIQPDVLRKLLKSYLDDIGIPGAERVVEIVMANEGRATACYLALMAIAGYLRQCPHCVGDTHCACQHEIARALASYKGRPVAYLNEIILREAMRTNDGLPLSYIESALTAIASDIGATAHGLKLAITGTPSEAAQRYLSLLVMLDMLIACPHCAGADMHCVYQQAIVAATALYGNYEDYLHDLYQHEQRRRQGNFFILMLILITLILLVAFALGGMPR